MRVGDEIVDRDQPPFVREQPVDLLGEDRRGAVEIGEGQVGVLANGVGERVQCDADRHEVEPRVTVVHEPEQVGRRTAAAAVGHGGAASAPSTVPGCSVPASVRLLVSVMAMAVVAIWEWADGGRTATLRVSGSIVK